MAEAVGGTSKANTDVDRETIAITVKSQDGKLTFFKIKRDTQLKKLLVAYCQKRSLDYPSTNFLIDGNLFNRNKSPNQLELEDNTEIDAMVEQLGELRLVVFELLFLGNQRFCSRGFLEFFNTMRAQNSKMTNG